MAVVRRLLSQGKREDRALIFVMLGCLMVFIAQTPRLAREAFETGDDLQMLLGASLLAWLFFGPLLLYVLAGITAIIGKVLRTAIGGYGARMALFWALLASTPLMLLWGLTAGFVGPGIEMTLVGVLWCGAFAWFWVSGLFAAHREGV